MFLYSTVSTLNPEISQLVSLPRSDIASMKIGEERTDCGDGGNDFTKLELIQDGGLSGSVKPDHQDSHLLLAPETIEQLGECETHVCGALGWVVKVCGGGAG